MPRIPYQEQDTSSYQNKIDNNTKAISIIATFHNYERLRHTLIAMNIMVMMIESNLVGNIAFYLIVECDEIQFVKDDPFSI